MRRNALLAALTLVTAALGAEARQVSIGVSTRERPSLDQPERPVKTGTGRLRGRVVAAETGAILRHAEVTISSADIGAKMAVTDAQGRYEFGELPAGRFN